MLKFQKIKKMKQTQFLLILLIFLICNSCAKRTDIAKEKEAIMKLLQEEGDAFAARDIHRFSENFIRDSTFTRLDYYDIIKGWSDHETLVESWMKMNAADTIYTDVLNSKENAIIKVYEQTAWVICDNKWTASKNGTPEEFVDRQISFLEKVDGKWKFAFIAFIPLKTDNSEEKK